MDRTTPLVSRLVAEGIDHSRVSFGRSCGAVPGGAILEAGAARFDANGPRPVIGALLTNDQPSVELIVGAIVSGATLVSLPPPGRAAEAPQYAQFLRHALDAHGLDGIVARDDIAEGLDGLGIVTFRHSALGGQVLAAPGRDGFRLVQFSSGSTQRPKAVALDDARLGANIAAIIERAGPRASDRAVVSWLPLSHDMGLIGMLLAAFAASHPSLMDTSDIVLLDPTHFLRRPGDWIAALSEWRASWTAAPDFAYRLAAERRPPGHVDLGSLRCAIIGGEIVRAHTLRLFSDRYAGGGLGPGALCPAYGLAEVGLAVSLTAPGQRWRERSVSTIALADDVLAEPRPGQPRTTLVASGTPLAGYEVRAGGHPGEVGPIRVRGPSVGAGGDGRPLADGESWLHTGDVGFLRDGWLYVCGRADDSFVTRGRNLYAPAVESAVSDVEGVRSGRVAAVSVPTGEWVVLAEPAERRPLTLERHTEIREDIRVAAVAAVNAQPDRIHLVERGSLPFTPSGKLQRRAARARFLRGIVPLLDGTVTG